MKRFALKTLKIAGLSVAGILLLLFLIPLLFPGTVVEKVKGWANSQLEAELDFSSVRLSFFSHFPSLTVSLYDVSLNGSAPFEKDTLLNARELALGINIGSLLFQNQVHIDEIFVAGASIHVQVNEAGEANYNIYTPGVKKDLPVEDSSGTSLRLEKIDISDTRLVYDDRSVNLLLNAKGFRYVGKGDLSQSLFDLHSRLAIDSFDLYLDNEPYLINKKIGARLVTKVNTSSLALHFERNRLRINRLPVQFSGHLDFLQNGYDVDLTVRTEKSGLYDLITAFPPQYLDWLQQTEVKGTADLALDLKGQYIASRNIMPDLRIDMEIKNGFVRYAGAPMPVSEMHLDLRAHMPALDPDSLDIRMDTLFFNLGKDYFKGRIHTKGLASPFVQADVSTRLDLAELDRSLGLKAADCEGELEAQFVVDGIYDPVVRRFPTTAAEIRIRNGRLQTAYYPYAIDSIRLHATVTDSTGTLQGLRVRLEPFSFRFEGQPFFVRASLSDFENIVYDIRANGELDVARIYSVFAKEGTELDGSIHVDLSLRGSQADALAGNYANLHNEGSLQLKNIAVKAAYLPLPVLIRQGLFTFGEDKMWFRDFQAGYGGSDFKMNGYLQHVVDYMFSAGTELKGAFTVHTDRVNANAFMSRLPESSLRGEAPAQAAIPEPLPADSTLQKNISDTGVFIVPPEYDLSLEATAGEVVFDDLHLQDFRSTLIVKGGTLRLQDAAFRLIGAQVKMDAEYSGVNEEKALFSSHIRATDFNVKRAYDTVKLFRDLVPAAEKAEGIVSLDYRLKGALGRSMSPVYPSLEGGGTLSLRDVKVKGLKLFSVIGRKIENDSINDPNLKNVNIRSTIKNNVITIERFRFKVFGFRPRIEGKTNFDGQLQLAVRLGLPPLGIVGIPISVTGTGEDPIVKLGKRAEELEETEYVD